MDEKTLKDKLRELFENIKQKQRDVGWEVNLIEEKNGETIFRGDDLVEGMVDIYICECQGYEGWSEYNWPVIDLLQNILELAFEFTKE